MHDTFKPDTGGNERPPQGPFTEGEGMLTADTTNKAVSRLLRQRFFEAMVRAQGGKEFALLPEHASSQDFYEFSIIAAFPEDSKDKALNLSELATKLERQEGVFDQGNFDLAVNSIKALFSAENLETAKKDTSGKYDMLPPLTEAERRELITTRDLKLFGQRDIDGKMALGGGAAGKGKRFYITEAANASSPLTLADLQRIPGYIESGEITSMPGSVRGRNPAERSTAKGNGTTDKFDGIPVWNPTPEEREQIQLYMVHKLATPEGRKIFVDEELSFDGFAHYFELNPIDDPKVLETVRLGTAELILQELAENKRRFVMSGANQLLRTLDAQEIFETSPLVKDINEQLQNPQQTPKNEILPFMDFIERFRATQKEKLNMYSLDLYLLSRGPKTNS